MRGVYLIRRNKESPAIELQLLNTPFDVVQCSVTALATRPLSIMSVPPANHLLDRTDINDTIMKVIDELHGMKGKT
jgi:hypothetical protein